MSYFTNVVEDVRSRLAVLGFPSAALVVEDDPGDDALATCDFEPPYFSVVIKVTPGFKGCKLWLVLYHEFGHALGLGHTKSGIMSVFSRPIDWIEREPTERQKQKWAVEIARLAFDARIKASRK